MSFLYLGIEATMGKRKAGDDADDQTLHAIAVPGNVFNQLIDNDFIVAIQLAAKRIRQKFPRQVAAEIVGAWGEYLLELAGSVETVAAGQLTGGINRAAGFIVVAPAANGVEVL